MLRPEVLRKHDLNWMTAPIRCRLFFVPLKASNIPWCAAYRWKPDIYLPIGLLRATVDSRAKDQALAATHGQMLARPPRSKGCAARRGIARAAAGRCAPPAIASRAVAVGPPVAAGLVTSYGRNRRGLADLCRGQRTRLALYGETCPANCVSGALPLRRGRTGDCRANTFVSKEPAPPKETLVQLTLMFANSYCGIFITSGFTPSQPQVCYFD
jgi:hypothetical protein